MRIQFSIAFAFLVHVAYPFRLTAQWTFLDLPVESQSASVKQRIGTTDITINYSRPSMKGRSIWGDVVPYDELWRAGANENTTITVSSAVKVEGQDIAAGTYGLHMIPTTSKWTIVLSKDHSAWGSYFYKNDMDALRTTSTPLACPKTEDLTYVFSNVTKNSATLNLRWAELEVPVNIGVDVNAVVVDGLDAQLRGLTAFNWEPWYEAARYCHDEQIAPEKAMGYVDWSIRLQPNFENQALKADMLAAQGKSAEAAALKKQMIDGASNAQLNTYAYTLLNRGEKEEALRMFELNVKRNPKDPNAHDSLGEGYMMTGNNAAAIKSFKKSLSMDPPENVKANSLRCLKKLGVDTSGYETAKK